MSKHASTFVFLAVIAGTLIFCGASGLLGGLALVAFPLFLALALVSSLGRSYFGILASRQTHPPFSNRH